MEDFNRWMKVFIPIAAIDLGISMGLMVLRLIFKALVTMFKNEPGKQEEPINIDLTEVARGFNRVMDLIAGPASTEAKAKRKNDDTQEPEEKPKRKNSDADFLTDDGELMEVITDTGTQTLDDLIRQYDRMEDE